MSRQYFADAPYADPMIVSPSAIVATVETALWNTAQFSPIPANDVRAGKVYRLTAGGILTTASTGTLTITPRWGTTTGGATLGASAAQTVPVSVTNVSWFMHALMTVRTVGAPGGSNSTAMLNGNFVSVATLATGTAFSLSFGGTSASFDSSLAAGLFIGWTLSVAGSVTVQQVLFQSVT